MHTGRFRRAYRLRRSWEFRRTSRRGARAASQTFVLLVAPSREVDEAAAPRLGVTVSRRVGGAVVRNRVKRAVREWFRRSRGDLQPAGDVVIIARRPAADLSTRELWSALSRLARTPELTAR